MSTHRMPNRAKGDIVAVKLSIANISSERRIIVIITTIWRPSHIRTASTYVRKHMIAIFTTYMETKL